MPRAARIVAALSIVASFCPKIGFGSTVLGCAAWRILRAGVPELFFRFAAALVLVVLVSMTSVFVEKRTLELRRQISVQYYQTDVMIEMQVQLRLEAQRLLAPALSDPGPNSAAVARKTSTLPNSSTPPIDDPDTDRRSNSSRLPLLRFQQPFRPEGID